MYFSLVDNVEIAIIFSLALKNKLLIFSEVFLLLTILEMHIAFLKVKLFFIFFAENNFLLIMSGKKGHGDQLVNNDVSVFVKVVISFVKL